MVWLVLLVAFFGGWDTAGAQLWAPVLAPSRGANWQGAVYTPPDTSTWAHCPGSPLSPPSSSAQIQSVIDNCGAWNDAGQRKIVLNAGTFTFATGFDVYKSNLVIEGQGANQTEIAISTGRGCNSWTGICFITGYNGNYFYQGGGTPFIANIIAGVTQGSTSLTVSVSDGANYQVGDFVIITQLNEDNTANYAPQIGCLFLAQSCLGDNTRTVAQPTKITGKSCSANCVFTIQSPLYFSGWKQSLSPQMWAYGNGVVKYPASAPDPRSSIRSAISNVGLRNLKVTPGWTAYTAGGPVSYGPVQFFRVNGGWIEGVTFNGCDSGCTSANESVKITIRHNYLFNSRGAATSRVSSQYGVVGYMTTDYAIYNNVIQQIQAPIIMNQNNNGTVIAYNFTRNQVATANCPPNPCTFPWNWAAIWISHAGGNNNILVEGNDVNTVIIENLEGNSCCFTMVRNFLSGRERNNGFDVNRVTIAMNMQMIGGRFNNLLGNVMGTAGWHNNYESSRGPHGTMGVVAQSGFAGESSIYWLGQRDTNGDTFGTSLATKYDPIVESSMFRWGNYDTFGSAVRWCGTSSNTGWASRCGKGNSTGTPATEVPSGQFVPASESVPTSFVFSSKPSWFGSIAWPPIGPEVTGGTVSVNGNNYGGRVHKIPARACYENMGGPADGTGPILNFNQATCYTTVSGDTTPPAAPTGVTIQ